MKDKTTELESFMDKILKNRKELPVCLMKLMLAGCTGRPMCSWTGISSV